MCSYADGTANGAEEQPIIFINPMGMKRGAADGVCRYRPGRDGLKGEDGQSGGDLTSAITVAPAPAHATMYR